jgi:hypothetical protein
MKRFNKFFLIVFFAVIVFAGSLIVTQGARVPISEWKKIGTVVHLKTATDVLGDNTYPIADGEFTALTIGTLSLSGVASGDIDLDGNNIDNGGVIFLKEQADANTDVEASGQIWVNTATPNELYFTDDAGTDFQLGVSGATTELDNLGTVAINTSLISDAANTDDLGTEALYWKKAYLASELSFEGATDDDYQTTFSITDTTTADRTITVPDSDQTIGTATVITDGLILEADLNADESPTDNDILTFDTTGDNFSWQTPAELSLAATNQTMYIGTTAVAINRGSAALTLAGITLTTPDIGTPSAGVLTNCSGTAASLTAGAVTGFTPASGSLTLSGADALTITTTGATNSTLPLGTKTLVATDVATLSSLTSIGTVGTGTWEATDVGVAHGGTGKSSWTQYLIPYADTTTSFSQIPIGTATHVLTSNGAGSAPTFQAASGSSLPKVVQTTNFDTAGRHQVAVVAGGTNTWGVGGVEQNTSATISSSASVDWKLTGDSGMAAFADSPIFTATLAVDTIGTDFEYYVGIGNVTVGGAGHTFTNSHAGFKIVRAASGDTELFATNANGSSTTTSAALTTMTGQAIDVIVKFNSTTSIDFYWRKDGSALSAATNHTTNLPSANENVCQSSISNVGVATASRIDIGSMSWSR